MAPALWCGKARECRNKTAEYFLLNFKMEENENVRLRRNYGNRPGDCCGDQG